jgi:hypothetical protein
VSSATDATLTHLRLLMSHMERSEALSQVSLFSFPLL